MAFPRYGTVAVSFLPQISGVRSDFWAGGLRPPDRGHAAATPSPQIWMVRWRARHQALARIEL